MKFIELPISGCFIVESKPSLDNRGFFTRNFCKAEFKENGLNYEFVQCSTSYNEKRGTLRGLHYQEHPFEEVKLVRCIRGAIFDVLVDLRSESTSYLKFITIELLADGEQSLYVPKGIAHGFQTLCDQTEVSYQISEYYTPEFAKGIRWDDPSLKINWPILNPIISDRDARFPNFHLI